MANNSGGNKHKNDGVFVLGMSCRVAKSNNIEEFWNNLKTGVDMVEHTDPRWPKVLYGLPEGLSTVKSIDEFDYEYFNISKDEADKMDPQIRLLLEVATEAIIDSGVKPSDLSEKKCGVYTSVYKSEVQSLNYPIEHCSTAMHASKLVNFFHLNGPSVCIDSACSSSLVATNLAFVGLKEKYMQYALVTATSLLLSPNQSLQNYRLGMTSESGKCHSWDEKADGYIRAEGIFAILLGRGTNHPRLYAEIVAGSTNSDGYKPEGITYPSQDALLSLFRQIYSKVPLSKVVYMECHAPGTQAGDVAETGAICDILKEKGVSGPLLIGSSKSNIGHAEWAAGLASLIKAVLCIYNKCIPPNLNLVNANPRIDGIQNGTLIPITELCHLPRGLVGVTAMGFGGSNCHLVLKAVESTDDYEPPQYLLLLCASMTSDGLLKQGDLIAEIKNPTTLAFISRAFSSSLCSSMLYRKSFILTIEDGECNKMEYIAESNVHKKLVNTQGVFFIIHDIATIGQLDANGLPLIDDTDNPADCSRIKFWVDRMKEMYEEHNTNPRAGDECFSEILTFSAIHILATLCVLSELGLILEGCIGAGLSDLIAASLDNCIYPQNVLIMLDLISHLLRGDGTPDDFSTYEVDTYNDHLPAKRVLDRRIISSNSWESTTVSFVKTAEKELLEELDAHEITYRPLTLLHPDLYTESKKLRTIITSFQKSVDRAIFVGSKGESFRSDRWLNTRYSNVYGKTYSRTQEPITAQYVCKILSHATYLNSAIGRIPETSNKVHIGMRSKPHWVPDDDVYIDASSYLSILQGAAVLHLKGLTVDPTSLNNAERTFTRNCPNVGHFIHWKHTSTFSVPHWQQFSATVKEAKENTSFLVPFDGSLESLLIGTAKQLRFFKRHELSEELYNLELRVNNFNPSDDNFILIVFTASKTFNAVDRSNSKILVKGNYKFEEFWGIEFGLSEKSKNQALEIDFNDRNKPINFEVTWSGNVVEYLKTVMEKLQQCMEAYDEQLSIHLFALNSSALPQKSQIGKVASFTAELTCGICQGNGIILRMSAINLSSLYRTSSNLHLPLSPIEMSGIFSSPQDSPSIEVHMLRLYQLKDSLEHKESFVLVYCRKTKSHDHSIGISLIKKKKISTLLNVLPIPAEIDCMLAIGIVVPYILGYSVSQILEEKHSHIEDLVVLSTQPDYLVLSLLANCHMSIDSIYALMKSDGRPQLETIFRRLRSESTDLVDFELNLLGELAKRKDSEKSTLSNLSTVPCVSLSFTESIETRSGSVSESSSTSASLNTSCDEGSFILTNNIFSHLFTNVTPLIYGEKALAFIKTKAKHNKIRHIVSWDPDLLASSKLLGTEGILYHMGEVNPEGLGIGLCSQRCTIQTLNPLTSLTGFLDEINDSSDSYQNNFWGRMWKLNNSTSAMSPYEAENNTAYRSNATVSMRIYVALNTIHKRVQNSLVDEKPISLNDLDWMGKLHTLVWSAKKKTVEIPLLQSPSYKSLAVNEVRLRSSAPQIRFGSSPQVKKLSDFFYEKEKDFNLSVDVPLSRPNESTIVEMNDVIEGEPVFLIHPVTGVLNLLRDFALKLNVPCYGIRQTLRAPTDSLTSLALHYLDACQSVAMNRPLRLIGYSYGACVAFVMAVEGQKLGYEVANLIMLDGSPDYVKRPMVKIRESHPDSEVDAVLDTEKLIAFLQIYGNVEPTGIAAELMNAKERGERVEIAANHLNRCISCYDRCNYLHPQNRWQIAIQKVVDQTLSPKLFAATKQILLKQRTQKAYTFLANMDLVDAWTPRDEKFNGDVYLFRVRDPPLHCLDLTSDYGLGKMVTGKCTVINYEDVNHESLVGARNASLLVNDIELRVWKRQVHSASASA